MKARMSGIGLRFAASLFVAAQHQRDSAANRSKLLPLKRVEPGGGAQGGQGSRRAWIIRWYTLTTTVP
jgi:hypothetical protein